MFKPISTTKDKWVQWEQSISTLCNKQIHGNIPEAVKNNEEDTFKNVRNSTILCALYWGEESELKTTRSNEQKLWLLIY